MADRVYSREEADAILARAIELQGRGESTSHADLAASAREIGIPPDALERAAAEVLGRRSDDRALSALRAERWRGFLAHLVPYVFVGALLGFINFETGGFPWAVIPMLGWAVGLATHLLVVILPPNDEQVRARVMRQREREGLRGMSARALRAAEGEPSGGRVRVEAERAVEGSGEDRAGDGEADAEVEQGVGRGARHG